MKKNHFFLCLLVFGSFMISCERDNDKDPITDDEKVIEFEKEGELSILKADGTLVRSIDIEVADNQYERDTGLMHREAMDEDQGMLFIFEDAAPRHFYMKNTYIPLDILYFNSDSVAVSFQENTTPLDESPLPSEAAAQYVLEINAGLVEEWDIEIGDKIDFELLD